ncbi:unnamed protein product [Blepharisma stoltei]|uniref:TPX2 C-terminal domain-containing protein n=1 Tax=Blepharisma stoltei TaxID=1481888 RepID=A0AAU9IP40_9CILI|nr:unnamed protein product [Blepharisma stoltei]
MEFKEKSAIVSSRDCPVSNFQQKRPFMPGFDTKFNDNKKRKLWNGVEHIKAAPSNNLTSEERELLKIEAEINEFERQKLLNLMTYQRSKNYTPINLPHHSTVPQPFVLRTEQIPCAKDHLIEERCLNARPIFKARPMPRYNEPPIYRSDKKLTVPREFEFSTPTSTRHMDCHYSTPTNLCHSVDFSHSICDSPAFHAKEMPDFSNPFTPTKSFTPTKFQPFHLKTEERGSSKKKSEQLEYQRSLQENSISMFRATPMPDFTPPSLKKSERPPTTPIPFVLATERRSMERPPSYSPSTFQNFKAKPMPDFSHPFFPVSNNMELTQPMDIELHTDKRAEERAAFEESLREKERQESLLRSLEEQERKKKENHEVQLFRKQAEFRARPMPGFYYSGTENNNPNFKEIVSTHYSFMETETSITQDEEMTDAP